MLNLFLLQPFRWGLGVWLTTLTWVCSLCVQGWTRWDLVLRGEGRSGCVPPSTPRASQPLCSLRESGAQRFAAIGSHLPSEQSVGPALPTRS